MAENLNTNPTATTPPGPASTVNGAAVSPGTPATQNEQRLSGISRSMIIGVGGTGHKIMLDVRQRLLQKYGDLKKVPIISFLLLDTDQAIFGKNPNYSDAANLDNADKIHTSVYGVENLRRSLNEYPHLREWLDPRTLSGDISQGAGAVRSRGRLAFFWNYGEIAKRIEEEAKEIVKDSNKAAAIKNGLQVSEGVTVYIVGSLLGGTGSGMFLDLAYTVKELLKSQRMLEMVGIFGIPPNSQAVAVDNRPNAYASLLELNHYTDISTTFTAQYDPNQPGINNGEGNADPPFRYCYLVDTSSPKATLDSVDKLVEMIGHSVFLDLTSEFQRQKKSNRDNFDQFLTVPDDLGCPQNYLSMGLSAINFPRDKVLTACSSRLARQIIERWTTPLDRMGNVGAFTEAEIGRLGLDPDAIQRQVTVANIESGELLRDTALGFWNNVNREYESSYPGHNRVTEFLYMRQSEHQARMVDSDPNPDLLGKQRQNLGQYIFQMQQNLRALLPAKEDALRGFISECVNNPNRRHGIARGFLDQASERFRAYSEGLGRQRDAAKESLAPISERRDAQIGAINNRAGDIALAMIMNAKRREIDEKKTEYITYARQWDTTVLESRAIEAAIYFYDAMAGVLEKLKAEMDAYIERMKSLEVHFRKEEQTAVENPVDVNGVVMFDSGRRVESETGGVTYVDGDIDNRYGAYVGDGSNPGNSVVATAANDSLVDLGTANNIYGLRDADRNRIIGVLTDRSRRVFAPVAQESVLDKFFARFGVGTDRSVAELRRVHDLSQPFIHLQENAPNYKHSINKEQTIVGLIHGAEGRTEAQQRFLTMLRDTVQGIRDGQISNSNEEHQVLFLRERAAFPLRLLEGMESYRFAYDQAKAQGATANPIHTRRDIKEWIRIDPPSFNRQTAAWRAFVIGWAVGVITEERDMRYTATGSKESVKFIAEYRDRFGMQKTDPLGMFISITGDMAKLMRQAESVQEQESKPPREAHEIILVLCDNPLLRDQIDRGIEDKLQNIGIQEMGHLLLDHAAAQLRRFPTEIIRPYQKAIQDYLTEINYNPNAAPVTVTPTAPVPTPALPPPTPVEPTPPALPTPAPVDNLQSIRDRLAQLKTLRADDLISEEEFKDRRAAILAEI